MIKKILLSATVAGGMCIGACAQNVALPKPNMNEKTLSVSKALATRHSVRDYSDKALSLQQLSNLCWAACGVARDAEHRTAPTARNLREIRLFTFTADKVYEYIAEENSLRLITEGDHRDLIAGTKGGFSQDFVKSAPVCLVMVIDFEKYGSQDENALKMGCVDAGNVSENINLYCQAAGLATVPRATMDVNGLRKLLGLTEKQLPIMNNPVGFPKK